MPDRWQRRIQRAAALAARGDASSALLRIYSELLTWQAACAEIFAACREELTGAIADDLPALRRGAAAVLPKLAAMPTSPAAQEARRLVDAGAPAIDAMLHAGWIDAAPDLSARLVLQPYAECLAALGRPIERRDFTDAGGSACPYCGGPPQLGILEDGDERGRTLCCAMCATAWPLPRLRCPSCGESDERRLGYLSSPEFAHVRVDVCETCKHYVKTIDVRQLGHAVPLVDEIAAAALDVVARREGYTKIALNLVGM